MESEYLKVTDTLLAQASQQAYNNKAYLDGFESEIINVCNNRCIVFHNKESVIISFAGTNDNQDILNDLKIEKTQTDYGKIHKGFLEAYESLEFFISRVLHVYDLQTKPTYITGHSAGGAIALLCAINFVYKSAIQKVVTFGAPKVGNKKWQRCYSRTTKFMTKRYINNQDVIPRLPKWFYYHVGIARYFNKKGKVVSSRPWSFKKFVLSLTSNNEHRMRYYYENTKKNKL